MEKAPQARAQAVDNKSLAWFKLSEFVLRGEKERAFSIYKVLILAFDNVPFCLLIEGDLHISFDEPELALTKYLSAAKLYEQNGDIFLAAISYESLINTNKLSNINPNILITYWQKLLELYQYQNYKPKIVTAYKNLFHLFLSTKNQTQAERILEQLKTLDNCMEENETWALYMLQENEDKKSILEEISRILESHFTQGNSKELQKFLSKLETLDQEIYNKAITQMKDKE